VKVAGARGLEGRRPSALLVHGADEEDAGRPLQAVDQQVDGADDPGLFRRPTGDGDLRVPSLQHIEISGDRQRVELERADAASVESFEKSRLQLLSPRRGAGRERSFIRRRRAGVSSFLQKAKRTLSWGRLRAPCGRRSCPAPVGDRRPPRSSQCANWVSVLKADSRRDVAHDVVTRARRASAIGL